ncbi:hypothetical protein ABZ499_31400 [Streptomyces sp. NPDC019990]|uniref:hypothetical protein n=1 Tax=Streptomyces sp. NPDC019990 TaxID=3154693 RepID=UPI0033CA891D
MTASWENIVRVLTRERVSDAELAYRLGCRPDLVRRARAALGMDPMPLPASHTVLSDQERLVMFSEPLPGGHRRWLGSLSEHGTPTFQGASVRRIAFRLEYGREPDGRVLPRCQRKLCVAGAHQTDQPMRDAAGPPPRRGRPLDTEARERAAELLKANPVSNDAAAALLGIDRKIVAEVRATLGIPRALPPRKQPTEWTREAFEEMTVLLRGGHRRWRGRSTPDGVPMVGRTETAYRLAFRLHYEREPDGPVRVDCERKHCVEGSHLKDRIMRQDTLALHEAGGVR